MSNKKESPLHIINSDQAEERASNEKSVKTVWYKKGLRFSCTQCGKCCTGKPGYVWLDEEDLERIIAHLKISVDEFAHKYLRLAKGRLALRERPVTFDCIFLKGKQCQIYNVRPKQCKTFPWWPQNLESQESWEETAAYCEGIRDDADLVSYDEIKKSLPSD